MVAESVRRFDSGVVSGMVSAAAWQFVCAVVAEAVSRLVTQVMCATMCEVVAVMVTVMVSGTKAQMLVRVQGGAPGAELVCARERVPPVVSDRASAPTP
jgi:hypothetical protein